MYKYYKREKKEMVKGITLISLVITIIVLLVLSGIIINMIFGNDGVVEKAQWSKYLTRFRQDEEKVNLYTINQRFEASNIKIASLDISQINTIIESGKKAYPITDERVQIENISETLKQCIKYIEKIYEEDITEDKVILYKADKEKIASNNNYVINIVSGKLYEIEAFQFQGKLYHRPEYGVVGANSNPNLNEESQQLDSLSPFDPPSEIYEAGLAINPETIEIQEGVEQNLSDLITITLGNENISVTDVKWYQGEDIEDIDEYEEANLEEGEEEENIEENDYEDDVITINDGKIIGEVSGESTKIYAIYKKDGKTYQAYLTVKVLGEESEIDTNEWLPQVELTVNRGKYKAIKVKNNAGKRVGNARFNWTTEDQEIATVGKRGIVNGKSGVKNNGSVKLLGTLKSNSNIKVECQVTVLELTSFTPTVEISENYIKIQNSIDKKYGMIYYKYIIDETIVAKKQSKKYRKQYDDNNKKYVVKVIASNGKYSVTSNEVEIITPELEYTVVATNNTSVTGWKQNTKITTGTLSGYTVTYYCSTYGATSSSYTTTTEKNVSNQTEGTTYYVWAIANKGAKSIKSTNYAIVTTKHTHNSNCYSYTTCPRTSGYEYWTTSTISNTPIQQRWCANCGAKTTVSSGYRAYGNGDTSYKKCKDCGATISLAHTSAWCHLCPNCVSSTNSDGRYNIKSSTNGNLYAVSAGTVVASITHASVQTLICSIGEVAATVTYGYY